MGEADEARRKTGREYSRASTTAGNKKSTKSCGAYIARSCIRNSRRNVTVRIDDYDDITLIWLLCIIRGIELAKDSPWDKRREGEKRGTNGERAHAYVKWSRMMTKGRERKIEREKERDIEGRQRKREQW